MEQFPSNSKRPERAHEEPKRVERVVQGEVVRRKTPLGRRMTQNLIGGDAQSVWGYVIGEVLIPAGQDMFLDAIRGGFERLILGDSAAGRARGRTRAGLSSRTDYHGISNRGRTGYRDEPRREISHRGRATHSFDEIILQTRVEGEEVLNQLDHLIDKYDAATVSDLYELLGLSGNYTDQKWGWTDLRGASVSHVRGGYLLNMPKPEPVD